MVAYNFIKEFADAVESGRKRHTIRKIGRRKHAVPGDKLQLYTGMQTKSCRLLMNAICTGKQLVKIDSQCRAVWLTSNLSVTKLTPQALTKFIRFDGFASEDDFFHYFNQEDGSAFSGVLIEWEPLA